ncbi:MAG: peptidase M4 family protein [Chloroflexales bacterium]|nr:peptidase M4 family protein [Chloroflexales bacterium]
MTPRRQHVPLLLLAFVYLLATAPLVWPQNVRPLRFAPGLARPTAPLPLAGAVTPQQALAALQARTPAQIAAAFDPLTGVAEFVSARHGADRLPYTPTAAEAGKPEAIARGFLDQNRALFGLRSAADELRLLRHEPDPQLGFSHIRLDQVYKDLPVFGRQLVVHLDPQQQIVAVSGQLQPDVEVPTTPAISAEQAMATALADLKLQQLLPFELAKIAIYPEPADTHLAIYADYSGNAALVWQVTILTAAPLGQWTYFVNASRPVVVHAIDGVMPIKRRRTFTAQNTTRIPGRLLVDEGERARDPVAQAAHDGAGQVYDYYFNNFKRNSIDGQGMALVSTVNYGSDPQDAENAAWVGEYGQMIYGDGGQIFKPLPYALDVIGHEFTHGVIESSANLLYEVQPGALNESYADVFGAMIDRENWTLGEDVIKSPPFPVPYLRSLEDPNANGFYDASDPLAGIGQPATMDQYANLPNSRRADNGGVHINSGIPNHAHYLMAQAIGREKTEQVAYRALTQYLSPSSDFVDAANASVRAAQDLFGQGPDAEAVQQAFAQVGITTAGATPGGPVVTPGDVPSGGPAPQQPQAPLPAGCTDIIVSGGFEQDTGWTEVVRGDTRIIDTQLPRSGRRSAWLGGTDQETLQYIYQDVSIPANATRVELRYARFVHFETTGLLGAFSSEALFSTIIANASGDPLATLEELQSSTGDDQWRDADFDLSRYGGRSVRLIFAAENPRGNVSSMFVDDVALVACTTGAGPAAPSTSSDDLVYLQGQIVDASTRRGIEGVQFFVLRPDLTASQAASDDNITSDEILTFGVTDRQGLFQTEAAVPRGQRYSVIVFGSGYRPIIADNEVDVPNDATNPYRVDAELRRGR